jgi:DNA-binding SARP family transcriptional activator
MASLEIRLLGGFEVLRDGAPLRAFRTRKARALLAYLALHAGQPLSRAALAGLLWPEQPSARAAQSLRQALTFLRDALGDDSAIHATRDEAAFYLSDERALDVAEFERQLAAARVESWRAAVRLYRGVLLDGFFVDDAPEFETWLVVERERLQAGALEALDRLAEFNLMRGEYASAKDCFSRALALDPWRESAHRGLMRALALSGEPAAALAQYEKCRRALSGGLGVEALEATQALYRQLLARADDLLSAVPPTRAAARPQLAFAGCADEHARLARALAALNARSPRTDQARFVLVEGEAGRARPGSWRNLRASPPARGPSSSPGVASSSAKMWRISPSSKRCGLPPTAPLPLPPSGLPNSAASCPN